MKKLINFNKIFVAATMGVFALSGCEKSIIDDNDSMGLTNKNVKLQIIPYVNDYLYNADSIYYLGGSLVQIENVEILFDDAYFVDLGDTLYKESPVIWSLSQGADAYIYKLDAGSYSGQFNYMSGVDSLTNATAPAAQPEGSVLKSSNLYRGSGKGYNHVRITGKIVDPDKPQQGPSIDMEWVVGTDSLAVDFQLSKSFSLTVGKEVTLGVVLKLERFFDALSPLTTPKIKADPADNQDFFLAYQLQQNFIEAYKIQL